MSYNSVRLDKAPIDSGIEPFISQLGRSLTKSLIIMAWLWNMHYISRMIAYNPVKVYKSLYEGVCPLNIILIRALSRMSMWK